MESERVQEEPGSFARFATGFARDDLLASCPSAQHPKSPTLALTVRVPAASSHHHAPMSYSPPPPISPASEADQSGTVKKKRKRADANQLRVLNDVYMRTAFPSTEERHQLAKQLDMSPRSVQIWCVLPVPYLTLTLTRPLQVPEQATGDALD